MDLGFETIGNATLIAFDGRPVLVTDPWIDGEPYFGSWGMSHRIPPEQRTSILAAEFVWFSHGHPDHLNADSLIHFRDRHILLPAHVGGRIRSALESEGYRVTELPDARWTRLSARTRVLCLSNYNQDAILLIDLGGVLLVNANDASPLGWLPSIRRLTRRYARSFLLRLTGYNDADMMNFFDEHGHRLPSPALVRKQSGVPLGPSIARLAESYGVTDFVPFSSMHRYQREDSLWANDCVTPIDAHAEGFESETCRITAPFVRYDAVADTVTALEPPEAPAIVRPAADFGDDWTTELDDRDRRRATRYFQAIEHLGTFLDHVNLRVGGRDHVIPFAPRGFKRGITFEVPRQSLMSAIEHQVFDDLLIGNYMRTILHGAWGASRLYPDFSPYVAKFADNGLARTEAEVRSYFAEYRRRIGTFLFLRHRLEKAAADAVRGALAFDSRGYRMARQAYWHLKGGRRAG